MSFPKPSRGQPGSVVFDNATYRGIVDAANAHRRNRNQTDPLNPILNPLAQTFEVNVKNDSSNSNWATGQPINLVESLFASYVQSNDWPYNPIYFKGLEAFNMVGPAHTPEYLGMVVCKQPINAGEIGVAVFQGMICCTIDMPEYGEWIERCGPDPTKLNNPRMSGLPNGMCQIMWWDRKKKDEDGNVVAVELPDTVPAIVWVNSPTEIIHLAKPISDIDPDDSGDVKIYSNVTTDTSYVVEAYLDWMHGDQKISANKEVMIKWFPQENIWRIIGAECEDPEDPA